LYAKYAKSIGLNDFAHQFSKYPQTPPSIPSLVDDTREIRRVFGFMPPFLITRKREDIIYTPNIKRNK
jgi:hypothetical protein